MDAPAGRETGQHVYPTLQEGTRVRGEYRTSKGVSHRETGPLRMPGHQDVFLGLSRCGAY